jgi:hypothetical protein
LERRVSPFHAQTALASGRRICTQGDSSKTNVAAPRASIGIDVLIACITREKFVGSSTDDATAAGDSSLRRTSSI